MPPRRPSRQRGHCRDCQPAASVGQGPPRPVRAGPGPGQCQHRDQRRAGAGGARTQRGGQEHSRSRRQRPGSRRRPARCTSTAPTSPGGPRIRSGGSASCTCPRAAGSFPRSRSWRTCGWPRRCCRETHRKAAIDRGLEIFPSLAARRAMKAGLLSGGEQQMLSLCRAFILRPKLIIADEMSLGLAPKLVDLVFESLATLKKGRRNDRARRAVRAPGTGIRRSCRAALPRARGLAGSDQ